MTLRIVKPGELPEDAEVVERERMADKACEAIRAAAKAKDGWFWVLTSTDILQVDYLGDTLETACVAEEVSRQMKLSEIGFVAE